MFRISFGNPFKNLFTQIQHSKTDITQQNKNNTATHDRATQIQHSDKCKLTNK